MTNLPSGRHRDESERRPRVQPWVTAVTPYLRLLRDIVIVVRCFLG